MKTVNDGTKSNFGDGSPLGMCDCSCLIGSSYNAKVDGFRDFTCGCSCGSWTQDELSNTLNKAP